jgi:hypothetical protein
MEIKKHISDASTGSNQVMAHGQLIGESNPFELAERLRESFAYLMEVPI